MKIRIFPGGESRAIHSDDFSLQFLSTKPVVAQRASSVEPVPSGPNAGRWFVDFTLLGEAFQYCLLETFARRRDALAAEVKHLERAWVLEGIEHVP